LSPTDWIFRTSTSMGNFPFGSCSRPSIRYRLRLCSHTDRGRPHTGKMWYHPFGEPWRSTSLQLKVVFCKCERQRLHNAREIEPALPIFSLLAVRSCTARLELFA